MPSDIFRKIDLMGLERFASQKTLPKNWRNTIRNNFTNVNKNTKNRIIKQIEENKARKIQRAFRARPRRSVVPSLSELASWSVASKAIRNLHKNKNKVFKASFEDPKTGRVVNVNPKVMKAYLSTPTSLHYPAAEIGNRIIQMNYVPKNYENIIKNAGRKVGRRNGYMENYYTNRIKLKQLGPKANISSNLYQRVLRRSLTHVRKTLADLHFKMYATSYFPKLIYKKPIYTKSDVKNFKNKYIQNVMKSNLMSKISPERRLKIIQILNEKPNNEYNQNSHKYVKRAMNAYYERKAPRRSVLNMN